MILATAASRYSGIAITARLSVWIRHFPTAGITKPQRKKHVHGPSRRRRWDATEGKIKIGCLARRDLEAKRCHSWECSLLSRLWLYAHSQRQEQNARPSKIFDDHIERAYGLLTHIDERYYYLGVDAIEYINIARSCLVTKNVFYSFLSNIWYQLM